jgi:predicted ArsR family transcriptional regulator
MHDLPAVVLAFVADHLRNIDELQLLTLCMHSGDRWWDADSVSHELGISRTAARRALDHLASRNLMDIRVTGDVRYQFRPGTEGLLAAAVAVSEAYRTRPAALINLVASGSRRSIRDFADAFRIRKDDDR